MELAETGLSSIRTEEQKFESYKDEASTLLFTAKQRRDWPQEWTSADDEKFIATYTKILSAIGEMPEQTPPAKLSVDKWGERRNMSFLWDSKEK